MGNKSSNTFDINTACHSNRERGSGRYLKWPIYPTASTSSLSGNYQSDVNFCQHVAPVKTASEPHHFSSWPDREKGYRTLTFLNNPRRKSPAAPQVFSSSRPNHPDFPFCSGLFDIQPCRLASGDFNSDGRTVTAFYPSFIPPCFSSSGQLPCETISSCDTPLHKKFTFPVNLKVRSVIRQNSFYFNCLVPPSFFCKHALRSSDEIPGIPQDLIDTLSFRYGTGCIFAMLQGIHAASLLAFRGFHACRLPRFPCVYQGGLFGLAFFRPAV